MVEAVQNIDIGIRGDRFVAKDGERQFSISLDALSSEGPLTIFVDVLASAGIDQETVNQIEEQAKGSMHPVGYEEFALNRVVRAIKDFREQYPEE